MMWRIGTAQVDALRLVRREDLTRRIAERISGVGTLDVARRYVDEALAAGLASDREIAEFALLLGPVDRAGRPAHVQALIDDPRVPGALKIFQVRYALEKAS